MARLPLAALLVPFVAGVFVADSLPLRLSGLGALAALGLLGALLGGGLSRAVSEALLAASLGAGSLAIRLEASAPEAGASSALVTLIGVPEPASFGCRALLYVHGPRPGRALVRVPPEACDWLPGQRALAWLELSAVRPRTSPGATDPRRRLERRGIHRAGRVPQDRVASVGGAPESPRAALERLRRRVGMVLDPPSREGRSGPLLRALVTGDRSRLEGAHWSPFERSGTAHLLSVSGVHIAWAFAIGRLLASLALHPWPGVGLQRARRRGAFAAGLVAAGAYSAMAGLSVPTLRSIVMAGAGAVAILAGRPAPGWNALAAAALAVGALDPGSYFEPPFVLSFAAVAGILLWEPRGGALRTLLGAGLGASLATAPIGAALGMPIPALGLLANLLLVPLFGAVVVPLGLLAALGGLLEPHAGALLAEIARFGAAIGTLGAELLASRDLARAPLGALGWAALGAAVLGSRARLRGALGVCRLMWAAAAALGTVAALGPGSYPSRGGAEALFLDAGQGDATLLRIGERFLLVDAGPRWGSLDAGRLVVLPALRAEGVRSLEVLALTHSDKDHIGGAWSVVDRARIGELWIPPSMLEDPSVRDLRRRAAARRIPLRLAAAGHEASIGDWRVRVLWPPEGLRPPGRNEGGLVLRVEGPEGCLLLPGDVPGGVEEALVHELSRCALLKLGHHGSRTSTSPAWLRALDPEVGIASASASFADRFPAADVRARLRDASVTLYETYRWGAIRVRLERPFPVVVPFLLEPLGSPAAAG